MGYPYRMPDTQSSQFIPFQTRALSAKGRALSFDGKVEVFGALPDEEVLALPAGRKKAFLRKVLSPSVDRIEPRCQHCPDCGGCALQQMEYAAQLRYKEGIIRSLFGEKVLPILGCKEPFAYRNKMEFSFSQNREGEKFLGLMLAGSRGRVFHLQECHLVSQWFANTVAAVRQFWEKSALTAYHHSSDSGHLRTLTLREAIGGKGKMVMLTVSGNPSFALSKSDLKGFVEAIKSVYPQEDLSVFLQVQQLCKGKPTQFFEMLLSGPDHITERLEVEVKGKKRSLEFKISPTSFFQPNTRQAEKLYSTALSFLHHLEGARVFDLYCGGATIGLSAAPFAKEVVGVELNHHSVFDAGWNKEVNGIENFSIIQGDVAEVLSQFDDRPDVVIVDPPRSGLGQRAVSHLLRFLPKEILYISCNPKTQAVDVASLVERGYQIEKVQPVDQFPHTVHIENIVHLVYP